MAAYLLDTNILLRFSDRNSPLNNLAKQAVAKLIAQGHTIYITSQNMIEFWAVATRPTAANGLGWTVQRTRTELEQLLNQFQWLEETPQMFIQWFNYMAANTIMGKRVHDARLVAVMLAHGITHLLTFNTDDFVATEGVAIVHPQTVVESE